ncbi:MAG TPA: hypothetical protein DDX72_02835 [Ruminococcaceae bacterium]|nr:hypothetical protein [Oscillospiraceae bacterium]
MPSKRVSEMSELEKRRYSLSARMFHTVILISVILFLVSLVISYVMYAVVIEENPSLENLLNLQDTARMGFLLQYALVMLIVTVILAVILTWHLQRTVVKPINSLTEAAEKYMRHEYDEETGASYFSDLDIRTGDEIEHLGDTMSKMENDMRGYLSNLAQVTAEKERIGTELNLATQIQNSMLPTFFPPFPDRTEFDLFADMKPAKEVGGDFYDFFFIDEEHLGLVIADVSGKGVPAALFMMMSKMLVKNYAMTGLPPAEVLNRANASICENNKNKMFVTVWFGVLDITTGHIKAANAGHEYPMIRKPGGQFEIFKDKHGFVLGAMKKKRYTEYEFDVEPGGTLFVYTDGAAEAANAGNELFGTGRMLETLNSDPDALPETLLKNMTEAINRFVGDAPQFDDLTMLCIKYNGKTKTGEQI